MRKTIIFSISFFLILIIGAVQFATSDNGQEWSTKDTGWFSFSGGNISGRYVNGSAFNRSIIPIFPPPEGKGIYILEKNNLTECKNRLIFSLDLISTPVIGKEFEFGEYYLKGEKIVGVLFYIEEHLSNYTNSPKVVLNVSSSDRNEIKTINLDLNKKFSEFDKPFLLDSSGLWKISIEFTIDDNDNNTFYVFENISKWKLYDNRNYLTFYLGDDSKLTFLNQYEKTIPVLSISELVGLQQMLLAKEQGEYLNDTANSLKKTADYQNKSLFNFSKYVEETRGQTYVAIILVIVTAILVIATISIEVYRQNKYKKTLFSGLYREICDNIAVINAFLKKRIKKSGLPEGEIFSTIQYENNNELYKIKNKELFNKILTTYHVLKLYNKNMRLNNDRLERLKENLKDIKKLLEDELSFLKHG